MFRLKITPPDVLNLASAVMAECQQPRPSYHQANGWACKLWFDESNALADRIMFESGNR